MLCFYIAETAPRLTLKDNPKPTGIAAIMAEIEVLLDLKIVSMSANTEAKHAYLEMWFKNNRNGLLALSEDKYGGKRELWAFHTAKTNDLDAGLAVTGLDIPLDNPYTHRCLFLRVDGVEMFSFSVMPKDRWPASAHCMDR